MLRVGDRLLLLLSLPELDALAPRVKEAVGDPDTVELRLLLLEGVGAALLLPLCVWVPLPVTLEVPEGLLLPDPESEPVAEGEAPALNVAVGVTLWELLRLPELLGVPEAVPDTVALLLGVALPVPEVDGVPLPLAPGLRGALAVELTEALRL